MGHGGAEVLVVYSVRGFFFVTVCSETIDTWFGFLFDVVDVLSERTMCVIDK